MLVASRLTRFLGAWAEGVQRLSAPLLALALVSTGFALHYTVENLGIQTDTADMISERPRWRQLDIDYDASFPHVVDTVLVVIDARTPDQAEAAARRLAQRLESREDLILWVDVPGGGPFFERHGLLYLDLDELRDLADRLTAAQPFLGALAADPTLRGLFDLLGRLVAEDEHPGLDAEPLLRAVGEAVETAAQGGAPTLSWHRLMLGEGAPGAESRRLVRIKPYLDFGELFPGGPVLDAIRDVARELELTPEAGVRIRLTGAVALAHEELDTVSRGAGVAAILALVLVSLVLGFGLRSLRLVLATVITLVTGLVWTAAFAAFAVGHLNLISIAFAVLYIGLGVDYAIHLGARYRELRALGAASRDALTHATADVGGSLVLCSVTTGVAFYAFVPTDFAGVSELGLISGTGMFISLLASLTVLPALLALFPPRSVPPRAGRGSLSRLPPRRPVVIGAVLCAAGAALALPGLRFDDNPLNLSAPDSESVATFRDLMADPATAPWHLAVVLPDEETGGALAERLEDLPEVAEVLALEDFVPAEQGGKLAVIEDLDLLIGESLTLPAEAPALDDDERRAAVQDLRESLAGAGTSGPAGELERALERLAGEAAGADYPRRLAALEAGLLEWLPAQLERLQLALGADRVGREALPEALIEQWIAVDGRHRIEVVPSEDLAELAARERFVAAVTAVAPDAIGLPRIHVEAGRAVVGAFQQALASAIVLVALIVLLVTRSARDTALVLLPLLLAGLLTLAGMVLIGVPLNFANVIALPLLLGVGVDNGIHMMHRARRLAADEPLYGSSTTRAVVISALTTIASFGNLALSPHPGTASMGLVLSLGLVLTLAVTLLVVPPLARGASSPRGSG